MFNQKSPDDFPVTALLISHTENKSSHEDKKALSPFYHEKIFLIENECKKPIGFS